MNIKTTLEADEAAQYISSLGERMAKQVREFADKLAEEMACARRVLAELPKTTNDLVANALLVEVLKVHLDNPIPDGPVGVRLSGYSFGHEDDVRGAVRGGTLPAGDYRIVVAVLKQPKV